MILPIIQFESFLPIIAYIHGIILILIVMGVIFQGKKSLSYPITRWQLGILIILMWLYIFILNRSNTSDTSNDA